MKGKGPKLLISNNAIDLDKAWVALVFTHWGDPSRRDDSQLKILLLKSYPKLQNKEKQ